MSQHRNLDIAGTCWRAHELSDKEMFACLTRTDYGDGSESLCEPCCAAKPPDFDNVPHGAYKPTDDGWQTRGDSPPAPPCLRSTPQSSWQPHSNANASKGSWVLRTHVFKQPNELAAHKPLVVEPQDEPAPSKPIELEVTHAGQNGIRPKRLPLPHTDEKNSLWH